MFFKFKSVFTLVFLVSSFIIKSSFAQTADVTWLSAKLNTSLNEKWSMAFRPIQRTQLNKGKYLNTSIDVSVTRRLSKQWSAQLLVRQFLVPDAPPDRTFFWTNLIHTIKLNPIIFKNTLRHHWGLNVHQEEADFFRWIPQVAYQFSPQIKLFVQSDVFFQFNQMNGVRQVRYQAGIHSKVSKSISFNFQYWFQKSVKIEPVKKWNMYVFNFIYTISKS